MSVVGGFQYIDLQGREMNSVTVKVDGIFNKIKSSLKPVVLCNFLMSGEEIRNSIMYIYDDGETMYGGCINQVTAAGIRYYVIQINNDDTVYITNKDISF